MTDITDTADFCRQCDGYGTESDGLGRRVTCDQCNGTGNRTVRICETVTGLSMQGEKNARDTERRKKDAAVRNQKALYDGLVTTGQIKEDEA